MPNDDDRSTATDWHWDETAIKGRKVRVAKRIERAYELSRGLVGEEKEVFDALWPFIEREQAIDKTALAVKLGISESELDQFASALFAKLLRG